MTSEDYVELLKTCVIERTQRDTFSEIWAKLQHMQAQGDIPATLSFQTQPDGRTAGIFTRFLSIAFVTLLGLLDSTQQAQQKLHDQAEQAIIEELAPQPYWEPSKSIPNKGGVEYRWFWLAAWFLHDHPGLNISGEEQSLETVFTRVCQRIVQMIGPVVSTQLPQHYLQHLSSDLSNLVERPLSIQANEQLPDFTAKFERYEHAKSKKRKLLCTLCNSAYPTEEQADSTVLFQPWVYKNKLSRYAGKAAHATVAKYTALAKAQHCIEHALLVFTANTTPRSFREAMQIHQDISIVHQVKPNIMVLASGDADFVPLIQDIRKSGIRVEIAAFTETAGTNMRLKCSG